MIKPSSPLLESVETDGSSNSRSSSNTGEFSVLTEQFVVIMMSSFCVMFLERLDKIKVFVISCFQCDGSFPYANDLQILPMGNTTKFALLCLSRRLLLVRLHRAHGSTGSFQNQAHGPHGVAYRRVWRRCCSANRFFYLSAWLLRLALDISSLHGRSCALLGNSGTQPIT